ncbi:hypothetical protein [Streptomyces sp. NPDC048340]
MLPVVVAVLTAGAGSTLPIDAGIRIFVGIILVVVILRRSLRRGIA